MVIFCEYVGEPVDDMVKEQCIDDIHLNCEVVQTKETKKNATN